MGRFQQKQSMATNDRSTPNNTVQRAQAPTLSLQGGGMTANRILQMQKAVGNQAVMQMLRNRQMMYSASTGLPATPIQLNKKPGETPDSVETLLARRFSTMAGEESNMYQEDEIFNAIEHFLLVFASNVNMAVPPQTLIQVAKQAILKAILAVPFKDEIGLQMLRDKVMVETRNLWQATPGIQQQYDLDLVMTNVESTVEAAVRNARLGLLLDETRINNPELREALTDADHGNRAIDYRAAARAYLDRHESKNQLRELDPDEKKALTDHLLNMNVIQDILSGAVDDKVRAVSNPSAPNWFPPNYDSQDGSSVDNDTKDRIVQAFVKIINMVESGQLEKVPVPNVVVNKDPSKLEALRHLKLSDLAGFRAYSNRSTRQIDIAFKEKIAVIVHEIGHQLEYFLPTDVWLDIQDLLRMRHQNAVDKGDHRDVLEKINPLFPSFLDQEFGAEAKFKGEMPATKNYSAKYYDSGNTEVMSMSMEFLSDPAKTLNLLEKDPLQAAIVLRGIQPTDFEAKVPDDLKRLLPFRDPYQLKALAEMESMIPPVKFPEWGNVEIIEDYFKV